MKSVKSVLADGSQIFNQRSHGKCQSIAKMSGLSNPNKEVAEAFNVAGAILMGLLMKAENVRRPSSCNALQLPLFLI